MEDAGKRAVERVIEAMRENLGEELTVDDMARTAMFSKFHFSRMFQRVTGISPARFLAAMRLQRAKQLLVSTSLSVTEISHQVGYSSVGTFSSRFSSSVGVSPRTYRRLGGASSVTSTQDGRPGVGRPEPPPPATVHGDVRAPAMEMTRAVFVGLFPVMAPQGRPVSCTVRDGPGPYALENVPVGTWYLLAYSACGRAELAYWPFGTDPAEAIGSCGPLAIRPGTIQIRADVPLRPMSAFEPPELLALLGMRSQALRVAG